MATERQIRANRANAAKSTGPITPEGKRASSQNATRHHLVPGTVVLKGESMRRFNDLAAALILQFPPRNPVEAGLVQTMTVARWRLLRMWGIQTAAFELEMARARQNADPVTAASGAVLAAVAFRTLADSSRSLALMLRFEAAYDGQYNRALALLLKLRRAPGPGVPVDPPIQIATETWDDDSQNETKFDADPGKDPTCNEQVPEITPNAPRLVANPISPTPPCSGVRMPVTHYEDTPHESDPARTTIAKSNRFPLAACGRRVPIRKKPGQSPLFARQSYWNQRSYGQRKMVTVPAFCLRGLSPELLLDRRAWPGNTQTAVLAATRGPKPQASRGPCDYSACWSRQMAVRRISRRHGSAPRWGPFPNPVILQYLVLKQKSAMMSNIPMRTLIGTKRFICVSVLLVLIATPALFQNRAVGQTSAGNGPDRHREMLDTYCVDCHNKTVKTGGLALDALDLNAAAGDAKTWEKVLRKLRGRLMPPPGNPQPPQLDIDAFTAWMENTLDTAAQGPKAGPKSGYVPIQRMNRTEYAASVKALVGVDVNVKDVLPQDIQVDGFDNIAIALSVSPSFLDQYITAARQVAKLAVGSPNPRVSNVKYSIAANQNPDEPLPLGTRGGIRFKHNFPADGEYRINILDLSVGLYTGSMENESTLVIMIDGKLVFRKSIGGPADQALADRKAAAGRAEIMERFTKIPVQVEAGVRDVVVAFIDRSHVESDENVANPAGFNGLTGGTAVANRAARLVDGVEIVGPYNPTGVSTTPSRALIFVCDPRATGESACAKQITANLARRAFRRPVTDEDVARLMPFYAAGREGGGTFDRGIEQVVAAVLASPEFLYRSIRGPKGATQNAEFALTDLELASRLSFFLWNTGPDEELLKLAAAGGLTKPGAMQAQVKRMMADPKASSLVASFAMKWLNIGDLDAVKPDPALFRGFNDQLRNDFSKEAEAFLSSILLEDRSVVDLLTSDRTFLNDRLARHYGISGVAGSQFREVTLADKERWGILGKAAVLLRTSYGDRTSPVLRGAWVLDKLMGTPPSPPPPNTATDLSQKAGEAPKTVRARLEQHRDKVVCKQCHGVIDPIGLPLETFDAIGQERTTDRQANNAVIDASTVLPNGVPIDGPADLRAQLAGRPAIFVEALTEKLMMYALNRELEYFDMPQVRAVVRGAAKDNYKFSSIVLGIVNADAFRKQGPAAPPSKEGAVRSVAAN